MKRYAMAAIIFILAIFLASCNDNTNNAGDGADNNGHQDNSNVHEHSFGGDYATSEDEHWLSCTYEGCEETVSAEHDWRSIGVRQKPTSDSDGSEEYICRDCKRTELRTIEKLPDRMPQEQWEKLFDIDNVRINILSGNTAATYEIDGEYMKFINSGGTTYAYSSTGLAQINFKACYADFSNNGNGLYTCDGISVDDGSGFTYNYKNVKLSTDGIRINKIELDFVFTQGDTLHGEYNFSDWGTVKIELPAFSESEFVAAKADSVFENFTLEVHTFEKDSDTATLHKKVYDGLFYKIEDLLNNGAEAELGECTDAARVTNPELFEILSIIDADMFIFDLASNRFVSREPLQLADGRTIDSVTIIMENGYIKAISTYCGDMQTHYYFSQYGTSVI